MISLIVGVVVVVVVVVGGLFVHSFSWCSRLLFSRVASYFNVNPKHLRPM